MYPLAAFPMSNPDEASPGYITIRDMNVGTPSASAQVPTPAIPLSPLSEYVSANFRENVNSVVSNLDLPQSSVSRISSPSPGTSPRDTAEQLVATKSPVSELHRVLSIYYTSYIKARLYDMSSVPGSQLTLNARRRMNSITSAASAAKKSYGVAVMEHMTTALAAELSSKAKKAGDLVSSDIVRAALSESISAEERRDRITKRVEMAAEAARIEKVRQKTWEEVYVHVSGVTPILGGAVKKIVKRRSLRMAQNCATAHKNNRRKKGMFDEYLAETTRLVELRERLDEIVRSSALESTSFISAIAPVEDKTTGTPVDTFVLNEQEYEYIQRAASEGNETFASVYG